MHGIGHLINVTGIIDTRWNLVQLILILPESISHDRRSCDILSGKVQILHYTRSAPFIRGAVGTDFDENRLNYY